MVIEELLVCNIIEQAVEDYKYLIASGISECKAKNRRCSIKEIRDFFNSEWCSYLLESIHCSLSGKDILDKLDKSVV